MLIDYILSWLAPHECLGCEQEGSLLCSTCVAHLPAAAPAAVVAVTPYCGVAKELVWKLKFGSTPAAARLMAAQMARFVPKTGVILVPVPTTPTRQRQRGYDQAALLARALARQTGLPCRLWLARSGHARQVGASRQQRLSQLGEAFRLTQRARPQGQHIILIDDVVTTGATIQAATAVLLAAGASSVQAVVFAQA